MIYSMTAFARHQSQSDWGILICELRSINHRYLEMGLHLPDALRVLEMPMREHIRQILKRGKIECTLRFQPSNKTANALFSVNMVLAKELCAANASILPFLENASTNSIDILKFPGVIETKEVDIVALQAEAHQLVDATLEELMAARGREGEELHQLFLQRLDAMQIELEKVKQHLPHVLQEANHRLTKRFHDAKLELDTNRLEQEMVIFAQRIDITEEIERAQTHIKEIRRVLKQGGMVGRRLDFLLQELNREANTLGSKSVDAVITHAAVELKVLIEQVREQVQNIE